MESIIKTLALGALTSFVIAYLIIPLLIKFSLKRNLVDLPGRRKIHKRITPSMGGIAIFAGFAVSTLVWLGQTQLIQYKFLFLALGVIFLIGIRDDLLALKVSGKLLGQILAASILIFLADFRIRSFYGLFGLYEMNEVVSIFITYLTILFITNSFNLIDGLDGLAGTISVITLILLGTWFYMAGEMAFSMLCFILIGGIVAFLIFNWDPSELFMGDTGALFIGLFLSLAIIHFAEMNATANLPAVIHFKDPVSTGIAWLIVPIADTSRIIVLRLLKGQSPFKPDKSHIHHAMVRLGFSHGKAVVILGTIQIGFAMLAFLISGIQAEYSLLTIFVLATVLCIALDRLILIRLSGKDSLPPSEL